MRPTQPFLLLLLLAATVAISVRQVSADDAIAPPGDVAAAIDRGLAFLAADAVKWRTVHNCASCHHSALVIWSFYEAKERGHAVNEPLLAELTRWSAENGDGKTSLPRPESAPRAFNEKAVSFALGLISNPKPDDVAQAGLQKLLGTIKSDQLESGAWSSWPETRPPIFGHSDERATLSATLALLPAAAGGDIEAIGARDRAVSWLTTTKSDDDPQSVALRLVLWQRLGRGSDELAPLVARIRRRQNADGGWSQAPEMASDAWATGQALYALAHAGAAAGDSAVDRARSFLVKNQREDGSWPMISRPTRPGGAPSNSLIPIVGAGSAWAVLGLTRSE